MLFIIEILAQMDILHTFFYTVIDDQFCFHFILLVIVDIFFTPYCLSDFLIILGFNVVNRSYLNNVLSYVYHWYLVSLMRSETNFVL